MTENFEKHNLAEQNPNPNIESNESEELEPQFGDLSIPEDGSITEATAQAETEKTEEIKNTLAETIKAEGGKEGNEGEEKAQKLEAYTEMIAMLKSAIEGEEKKTGFFAKMGKDGRIASLKKDIISVTNQKNIEEDYGGTNPASIIRQTKHLTGFDLKKYSAIKDKGGILSAGSHTFGGGANN